MMHTFGGMHQFYLELDDSADLLRKTNFILLRHNNKTQQYRGRANNIAGARDALEGMSTRELKNA